MPAIIIYHVTKADGTLGIEKDDFIVRQCGNASEDLCVTAKSLHRAWKIGDKLRDMEPVITKQNPILLAKVQEELRSETSDGTLHTFCGPSVLMGLKTTIIEEPVPDDPPNINLFEEF